MRAWWLLACVACGPSASGFGSVEGGVLSPCPSGALASFQVLLWSPPRCEGDSDGFRSVNTLCDTMRDHGCDGPLVLEDGTRDTLTFYVEGPRREGARTYCGRRNLPSQGHALYGGTATAVSTEGTTSGGAPLFEVSMSLQDVGWEGTDTPGGQPDISGVFILQACPSP